jgi:polyhydroxyalkanoate synthase
MTKMMSDPTALANAQIDLFNDSMTVWRHAAERMLLMRESDAEPARDKRFKHPDWTENAMFSFIRESYLVAAKSLLSSVRDVKGLDPANAEDGFYTRQFVTRFRHQFHRHQSACATTLQTGGQGASRGLEDHLPPTSTGARDISITATDMKSFRLGENIAATPARLSTRTI